MPRATKLTKEIAAAICAGVRNGDYQDVAAKAQGIGRRTLFDWKERAKSGEQPFADFVEQLEIAQACAEQRDLALIGRAAETQWQAAAWRLERMHPERYGKRDKVTVALEVQQELETALDKLQATLSPDEYARVLAILAAGDSGEETIGEPVESSETH